MSEYPVVAFVVSAIDWLIPVTVIYVWWFLARARNEGPSPALIALPLAIAFGWGMVWVHVPAFANLRLNPPPTGQASAIFSTLIGLIALLLLPSVRRYFRTARLDLLVAMGPWRIVYGSALMIIGTRGGLPEGFFWSAAIGDIAVGLWAIAILAHGRVSTRHLVAWNVVGMIDLTHVLVLGSAFLRPFFLANPDIPPLNLLPLVGVPIFLALHVLTLWGLWARSRFAQGRTAVPS